MSQSCTYTFKGPDGRKMTIEGASALKAYLATGGLEFLLGEARADLARRPEQVLASQGREGDWNRLPGTHATKAAAEATVKVKVNGAKGTKPNPAWREYEFRIGQGRDDQWYVDARKRPGAASMKLSDKISYEGVNRSANRQIDTPEFKTWSGGNPVVLAAEASKHQFETGKPVVVEGFHGTRRNFDRVDTAQASAGYFLTSKPLVADEYAGVYPEGMGGGSFPLGGNVQRQYVRMDNPLVINARGASFNRVDTRAIPGYPLQMSNTDAINQWAKSQGYDGIIYKDLRDSMSRPDGRNAPPSNVYVTFKPSFVKSAVGNSGEYSLQEESFLASRDRPGINVRSDGDNRYADLIVDGTKTMESRDSDSLRPYVGKTVGVVRTGEGPARLIGSVTVGEPMEVDATEFRAREDEHLVPEGSTFDIKPGKTKWLYPLTDAQRFEQEQPVGSRGIVSRKVRFSPDRAQIETPEFKRWFGDSKVVDANGEPLVVYHGTAGRRFNIFSKRKSGSNFDNPVSKKGFFFTPDRDAADTYADGKADDLFWGGARYSRPQMYEVYLSLQSPREIDASRFDGSSEADTQRLADLIDAAKSDGHDGVIIKGWADGSNTDTQYVAFKPAQIKSAIGNRGTFDPDDPDIRRSEGRQELPRGYVGPVSEEEREQGLLVKRLEDESFEAWGAGREKVTADTVRWVTERMREAGIEDSAVKEASISAARSLSLGKIAPGGEYDPETHPYFSDYRAAAGRLQSARNALQQMISARLGPPEFEGMRQLADFDREQVRTPEFRRWFKDSKVVDDRGRPLIVFHGTNRDLSEFATVREAGAVRNNNWFGQLGSWFAAPQPGVEDYEPGSAESTAEGFSELRGDEGSVVYPVYLSIQNPYEVEGYESLTEERDDAGGAAAFRQMLVKQGYDGVVVRESDTDGGQIRDDWVAFYPTQIKSAIGNRGTFSLDDPDITRSSGRDVKPLSIEQDSREWAVDGEPTITLNNARFGGGSVVQWVDGDKENYITSIAAYGDVRGHEMLRWLKEHTGKPSFAVDAVDDAIGFYERMGELGLVSGYTQDMVESFFGIDFGDGEPRRYAGDVRFDSGDARRSAERSPLGFYSALAKGIEDLPTKQAPAGAWKAAIKGLVNKGAAKADEVEWSGINDWLDLQQGKVTKEQVAEYLRQGGVRVEETALGGGRAVTDSATGRTILLRPGTKYSQYTLPGGENYREVLLTLPTGDVMEAKQKLADFQRKMREKYDVALAWRNKATPAERAEGDRLLAAVEKTDTKYRSNHWDQPNVLAHIRVNDRTDADGKRVLFVEELQSDWGQEGKKKGFARETTGWRVQQREDSDDPSQVEILDGNGRVVWQGTANGTDSQTIAMAAKEATVPTAPFVTKTEGWLNLALKRVMIIAAEGGYDKVAFVTGEQSAERFSLDKQIDSVSWRPAGADRATITISPKSGAAMIGIVDTNTGVFPRFESGVFGGEALESVLGKEIAERVLASPEGSLAGDGLKVEAKGMRAFYDTIVPTAVKKLLPKVGGGQMGNVNINSESNVFQIDDGLWGNNVNERTFPSEKAAREAAGIPQPGFDVTPAMRERVSEGLPLFSRDRGWAGSLFGIDFGDGEPRRYAGDVRFNRDDARRSAERFTDDQREELERAGRDAEDAIRSAPRDYNVDLTAQQEAEKPAKAWIEKVYAGLPRNPMMPRQRVMMFGEDDFAVLELDASGLNPGGVTINWIQAYPLRSGNGTKAIRELQRMAAEDGIELDLWPWDKGRVSQANLIKFYKSVGFEPIKRGSKNMIWRPGQMTKEELRRLEPMMDTPNSMEFRQRLQWLSEGMLRNNLYPAKGAYKISQDEIDLYRRFRNQPGSEGIRRSVERSPLGFYSALAKGIEDLPTKQAPGGAWKAAIKGLVNKGAAKADEVEWSGINDWLDLQQGKVTKEQVAEYLRQGGVRVEETQMGGPRGLPAILSDYFENTTVRQPTTTEGWIAEAARQERKAQQFQAQGNDRLAKRFFELAEAMNEYAEGGETGALATKYSKYTLPGGENYREVLLTLPEKQPDADAFFFDIIDEDGSTIEFGVTRASVPGVLRRFPGARAVAMSDNDPDDPSASPYKSNHWDQPNVLAHIRLNDRTDADGNRVLFVEELQSDWGQEGKKKGFRRTLSAAQQKRVGELNRVTEERDFTDAEQAEYDSLRDGFSNDAGLPAAPFVTKTEGWLNLALKRVMIMAAEGGYDKVAFVNGEQSADRYDLSKQVNYIQWNPSYSGGRLITLEDQGGKEIGISADPDGTVYDSSIDGAEGKKLDEVLGKELADKIMASDQGDLRGLDLKVGGEGMKTFYDTIVPTAVKKLLPKVGGGQMGTVRLGDGAKGAFWADGPQEDGSWSLLEGEDGAIVERGLTRSAAEAAANQRNGVGLKQPGFDVTPAMREKVSEGLPLFSRDRASWTNDRIDRLLSAHAYTMDDGRSKAYAGFVSPEDYLRATTPASGVERLESEKRPLDAKQLADQVQPIFLKGEPQGDGTWKTTGHEGRHRMMALRDAGVRRVPVVFDVGYGLTREPIERLYVTPQRWSGVGSAQGGFFVDGLIPISYKHAGDLRDTFGDEGAVRFSPSRAQTESPEFKAWFGDSKVVNALGRPRVVYHGTAGDVAIFDMGRAGQTYGLEGEKAFFFTGRIPTAESAADDATGLPAYARKYAYQGFGGGDQGDYGDNYSDEPYDISADYNGGQNLMPVYLSLQNPLIIDAPYGRGAGDAFENGREAPGQLIERAKREGYDGIIIRGKYRNREQMARILANTWTTEADKKKYLDELARKDARKHQTDHYFIAFRPDQIKSAIGNVGAYGQRQITEEEANRFGMGAMEANFRQHEGDIRFSVDRDYRPEKTVKAYKLFRMDERRPGELFPLFVDADRPVPMGKWLSAQAGPPAAGGKVKSKLGPLAYRPGWHAGDLPVATHIGMKKSASDGKPGLRNPEHVWAEVEMAADVDWQAEANKRGTNKDGKVVPVKAHITDEIPRRGFYRYKTNPNMTGNWLIGGEMKVNRILSDREVQRVNKAAGVADLPRAQPLDLKRFGFDARRSAERATDTPEFKRWFGDSKVVDAEGEPLVVYHGTAEDFAEFDPSRAGRNYFGSGAGRGIFFTSNPGTASVYAEQPSGAYLNPAEPERADFGLGTASIMPVYLSLQNPLVIKTKKSPDKFFDGKWEDIFSRADTGGHDGVIIRGGAEFKRDLYVAMRPEQIKSAIGNSGAFDPANPDITKSEDRATSAWQAPSASKFDDWVYKLQDKQIDTKRVVDEIKDVAGALADDLDVYLQEELFHGRAAKRTEDFVNKELRPLVDSMAKDGLKIEDLDTFLHARHAREANAVIAQRNPEIQDGGSGMTNQDAADYFANLDEAQRRKLEAAAAKVDAILAETRKMMVDYQLESPDVIKGWGQMFQHYVPLMREDEGAGAGVGIGQGFSIKGREVKSRTGSTRKVVDIFANIAMQRERTIVRGEKNRVSQALHGLAAASPNKEFWTVDKVPTTPTFNPATGLVEDRPDTLFKMRDNVIVSKVLEQDDEGRTVAREKAVIFNEKNERAVRMAAALKNLDAAQLEGLMGASAAVTRYFASINTQYNPVFGIINLMRDVQGAIVNLNTTELKDDKLKVARGTMSALMGIMADARKARRGEAGTSEWSALWEDFQSVGGQTGYRQLFQTSADRAKDIQRALNPDAWMDSRWGRIFTAGGTLKVPLSVAMKGARWLFDLLSDYNLAMENGIRLSAYKVALDKGMSRERAASLAKNLTVNFNRKGQVGQQAGALYAFFNAAMQGTARLGQVLFEMEPGKAKTIRLSALGKKVVYGGMLLGTTQALALAAAGFSDDDPPDFVRERSLIIPTGGKTYISIPMPLGLHVIPNIGRVTTEWALGGFKNTPQRVASLLGTFADSFNPIGNAGWSMQTLAPTALDPLVALTENKDWQGRPIAKESMNRDMPGPQLYRDTATSWGKLISESINYLSGGDKYSRGVLSPTPDQIDYLIGQLTGGVGREISKVEQTALGLVRGEDVPTYKVPLVGRLIGDSGSQASEGTAFYANAQKLNKLETEIKLLREDGKTAEAQALRASRPEAYLMTQANYAERAIQRLRKEKSELIKDGAPREKIREIEERITARMAGLNRAMEALEAAR